MIAQSGMEGTGLKFGFFDYAKVGVPILIVGIIYFAFIGYKFLPNKEGSDEGILMSQRILAMYQSGNSTFLSNSATLVGMIFEEQLGIKLCVIGCMER